MGWSVFLTNFVKDIDYCCFQCIQIEKGQSERLRLLKAKVTMLG